MNGTQRRMRARSRLEQAGFTLAEAMIAVAISALSLGGVMVLNAHQLKLVRSTRQSNAASMALQDRIEQLRLTAWANLTNTTWLKANVFDETPECAQFLPKYTETVTLTPWGETSTAKMEVVNTAGGEFSVVNDGTTMSKKRQGRIDVVITWEGTDKRIRERSYATIISNGGITRVGLMGIGGTTTTIPSGEETTPSESSDPTPENPTPENPTPENPAPENPTPDEPSNPTDPADPGTSPSDDAPGHNKDNKGRGSTGHPGGQG